MGEAIVLAIGAKNADEVLSGKRRNEVRSHPPTRLPARTFLAVVGAAAVVGECELGAPTRRSVRGWLLPVSAPRRYAAPRPLAEFGLAKTPRSFRYVDDGRGRPAEDDGSREGAGGRAGGPREPARDEASSRASRRRRRA